METLINSTRMTITMLSDIINSHSKAVCRCGKFIWADCRAVAVQPRPFASPCTIQSPISIIMSSVRIPRRHTLSLLLLPPPARVRAMRRMTTRGQRDAPSIQRNRPRPLGWLAVVRRGSGDTALQPMRRGDDGVRCEEQAGRGTRSNEEGMMSDADTQSTQRTRRLPSSLLSPFFPQTTSNQKLVTALIAAGVVGVASAIYYFAAKRCCAAKSACCSSCKCGASCQMVNGKCVCAANCCDCRKSETAVADCGCKSGGVCACPAGACSCGAPAACCKKA